MKFYQRNFYEPDRDCIRACTYDWLSSVQALVVCIRRLQQYLHRQYKDCSRKRYSIILEALAYAIDYDKSFIYDLSMADKKLKKMYLEDFMEGFDYALYDSRYEENEAEE